MTSLTGRPPVPIVSTLLGVGSVAATVLLILVLDAIFVVTGDRTLDGGRTVDDYVLIVPVLNATAILQSVIGALIERRRPGHAIGRLLMASGILYAGVAGGWMAVGAVTDPGVLALAFWALTIITFPVLALLAGWLPLLYPARRAKTGYVTIVSAQNASANTPGSVTAPRAIHPPATPAYRTPLAMSSRPIACPGRLRSMSAPITDWRIAVALRTGTMRT